MPLGVIRSIEASDQLQRAIALIKSGDKQNGKRLLAEILKTEPQNEAAWLWMSSVVNKDEEQRYCLERALAINPDSVIARRGLARLARRQKQEAIQDLEFFLAQGGAQDQARIEDAKARLSELRE